MITLEEYNRLKTRADALQNAEQRALGALDQKLAQLKEEGYATTEQAQKALAKLEKQEEEQERTYQRALKEFEKTWNSKLEGL